MCLPHTQKEICKGKLVNHSAYLGVIPVTSDHLPAGKLRDHLHTWKVLTKDPWVLDTIRGYQIDYLSEPHQRVKPHTPHYSVEQNQLIVGEVQELLNKGAIEEIHSPRRGLLPSPRKGWPAETRDKAEGSEPICSDATLQDGGNPFLEGSDKPEGLVGKSKGAYFAIPIHQSHHQYLESAISSIAPHLACHQLLGSLPRP